jgi:hypothetical protein
MRLTIRILAAVAACACAVAAPAVAADWKQYRYPDEGFAVEFPAPPAAKELPPSPQRLRGLQRSAMDDAGTEYLAQATLYQPGVRSKYPAETLLRAAIDGLRNAGKCTQREARDVTFPGATAREVILDKCGEGSTAKARFVLLGDWLYLVVAIGRPGIEQSAGTARLIDSFTVIAK